MFTYLHIYILTGVHMQACVFLNAYVLSTILFFSFFFLDFSVFGSTSTRQDILFKFIFME